MLFTALRLFTAFDDKKVTAILLLDYSKAFDTLNYKILLSKLNKLGLSYNAVAFIKSYLTLRYQKTGVDHSDGSKLFSNPRLISQGVPQGSILGPLLITIYVSDLPKNLYSDLIMYADDTQLVISFF